MSENTPPPTFAEYPRGPQGAVYGSSVKLARLHRGYHGMSYTFLLGLASYILMLLSVGLMGSKGYEILGYLSAILPIASFVGMYYFCIRSVRDIGFAMNWGDVLSTVMAIFVPFMCLILCATFGFIASQEMKKYGIKIRTFRGIDKQQIESTIAQLAAIENGSQPYVAPTFQA